MSNEFTIFDEIANILYFVSFASDDPSNLEKKLMEMHDKSEIIFEKVLSSLLLNFSDIESFFSEEFRKKYIDNSENL